MTITTDRKHPDINSEENGQQNKAYLVLSEAERAKGFVRPVRRTYIHGGRKPKYPLRDLTDEQKERYGETDWVAFEKYPENIGGSAVGQFWSQEDIGSQHGCGTATRMDQTIAETYARNPHFYGSTWCMSCKRHVPVRECQWEDGETVGS